MATLQEQIAQAKAAGYSDDDIAKHLSARADLAPKIKQATDAGYKPEQIVAHLSAAPAQQAQQAGGDQPYTAPTFSERKAAAFNAGKAEGNAIAMAVPNLVAGGVRGAGSIGATLISPIDKATDMIMGDREKNVAGLITGQQPLSRNEERRKQMDAGLQTMGAQPDSFMYKTGKLGTEIAGTAGAGGLVGNGIVKAAPLLERVGMSAPTIRALANSAGSGGFTTGAVVAPGIKAAAANMGTRVAGGALAGGAGAGMVNPNDMATGTMIGGFLPPVLAGTGKAASYLGRSIYSLAQPFTAAGQERSAGSIINQFAKDGPTAINGIEHVAGSAPTLAEATGNAGIAGLQRNVSEVRPNLFTARQKANNAARETALEGVAGDVGKLDYFKASRADAAGDLYGEAAKADIGAAMTPYLKGQITQLLKRPSINEARKTAQRWAIERGEKASFDGNMTGLHDMKLALDDGISEAVRKGKGNEAKALTNTKDKLLDVMEKLSPAYREARVTYAEMSKPINQMEVLQGLSLTNSRGTMTLSKVQSALDGLKKKMTGPGNNDAKSLTSDQIGTLEAIRDDLLRQTNLGAGKAAGSNTLQNIATDNALSTMMPGKLGEIVGGKVSGAVGQIGRLMYSGPNEAIRNRMVDLMLDPVAAKKAMDAAGRPILGGQAAQKIRDLSNSAGPAIYRAAPALSTSQ